MARLSLDCRTLAISSLLGLVLWHDPRVLTSPPYWDAIMAVFREGVWLSDNHWDLNRLTAEESGYSAGGPRVYLISAYPYLVSLLYSLKLQPRTIFILMHGLNLGFAVLGLHWFYRLVNRYQVKRNARFIAVIGLASYPLLLSQGSAMNMEIGLFAFATWMLHQALTSPQGSLMSVLAVSGFLWKKSFILVVGGTLIYFVVKGIRNIPFFVTAGLLVLIFLLHSHLEEHVFYLGGSDTKIRWAVFTSWRNLLRSVLLIDVIYRRHLPLLPSIAGVLCLLVSLVWIGHRMCMLSVLAHSYLRRIDGAKQNETHLEQSSFRRSDLVSICIIWLATFHLGIVLQSNPLPRYYTLVLGAFFALLMVGYDRLRKSFGMLLGGLLICGNLANSGGGLDRLLGFRSFTSNGNLLERSLAQQEQIRADEELVEFIDRGGFTDIVAPWPYVFMLAEPRFGYTESSRRIFPCSVNKAPLECNPEVSGPLYLVYGNSDFDVYPRSMSNVVDVLHEVAVSPERKIFFARLHR